MAANYGTPATAYMGPNGDGTLDGRITRDGNDAGGSIVPLTILHHNDSHGNLAKGTLRWLHPAGHADQAGTAAQPHPHPAAQLGRQHPGRRDDVLLQDRPTGYTADGTTADPALQINPLIKAFNAMNYDAMTLGNHEFNFGKDIFTSMLSTGHLPAPAGQCHR